MGSQFISIDAYNKSHDENNALLNIESMGFSEGEIRLAMCERCTVTRDVNQKPFIRYTFRDINGRRIIGRQYSVEDLVDNIANVAKMKNRVVHLEFSMSYFQGFYLNVKKVKILPIQESDKLKEKFFTNYIKDIDRELEFFSKSMQILLTNKKVKSLYESFNVEHILKVGFHEGILDGLKGSPVKLVGVFSSISVTMFDREEAKSVTLAYLFFQALMAKAQGDAIEMLKEYARLVDLAAHLNDAELNNILEDVESAIYLKFNYERSVYQSRAIYVVQISDFIDNMFRKKSYIDNCLGVFLDDNKLFERRK